jgi:hypothetical protein
MTPEERALKALENSFDTTLPLHEGCSIVQDVAGAIRAAMSEERERILAIIDEEAGLYSYKEELIRPSIVAAIFVNSVKVKVKLGQQTKV